MIVLGQAYSTIEMEHQNGRVVLKRRSCQNTAQGPETLEETPEVILPQAAFNPVWFRVRWDKGGDCHFFYSLDGEAYNEFGPGFQAREGRWIGAKIGFFAISDVTRSGGGYVEVF